MSFLHNVNLIIKNFAEQIKSVIFADRISERKILLTNQ